jgi:hypothetical protein
VWHQLVEGLGSVGIAAPDVPTQVAADPDLMRRAVAGLLSAAWDAPAFVLVLDDLPRDEVVEAMVQRVLDELPPSMRVMIRSAVVAASDGITGLGCHLVQDAAQHQEIPVEGVQGVQPPT